MKTKLCTYNELNTSIGLEGAMRIVEAHQVVEYNERKIKFILDQEAKARGGRG